MAEDSEGVAVVDFEIDDDCVRVGHGPAVGAPGDSVGSPCERCMRQVEHS